MLDIIARDFLFPDHFGKNLDALYDCITDMVHKSGPQPGFVVVLESIPWATSTAKRVSSCSTPSATPPTSGASARSPSASSTRSPCQAKKSAGNWDKAEVAQNDPNVKPVKVSKNAPAPMIMNLPPMSSVFDTAALLAAA